MVDSNILEHLILVHSRKLTSWTNKTFVQIVRKDMNGNQWDRLLNFTLKTQITRKE
jgi:hypothetical protein